MNSAHLHMVLVHIPIVLMPTATILLALGIWRRQLAFVSVARAIFLVTSLITIPAFLLGEGAEEIVESVVGVTKGAIHEHEEVADIAFWMTVITGLQALATYGTQSFFGRFHQTILKALIILGSLSSLSLAYTAYQGGKIRHPEAYAPSSLTLETEDDD